MEPCLQLVLVSKQTYLHDLIILDPKLCKLNHDLSFNISIVFVALEQYTHVYLFAYCGFLKFDDFFMIPDRRRGRMNCFGFDQSHVRFGLVCYVHTGLHAKILK